MNLFSFLLVTSVVVSSISTQAESVSLENLSPQLSGDAQIFWKIGSNSLPKDLWTYQKKPQHFSVTTISNAAVLGNFDPKPLLHGYTKPLTIWDKSSEGDPRPDYFTVEPAMSLISFHRERRRVTEGDNSPEAQISRAWSYAAQLGLDKVLLGPPIILNDTVSLPRKVDGISFMDDAEGFSIKYGAHGELVSLSLTWPVLDRLAQERVCSFGDIERSIRAFKTPVVPKSDEPDYLGRIKSITNIRTLTITNITAFYIEGKFGEQPNEAKPEKYVGPVAVLDTIGSSGKTNIPFKIAVPLIVSDVNRLLKQGATSKP
jgi:hypothetical protein